MVLSGELTSDYRMAIRSKLLVEGIDYLAKGPTFFASLWDWLFEAEETRNRLKGVTVYVSLWDWVFDSGEISTATDRAGFEVIAKQMRISYGDVVTRRSELSEYFDKDGEFTCEGLRKLAIKPGS